jgi:hypothetical protein
MHPRIGLLAGLVAGLLSSSRAEATSCASGEWLDLTAPMVVVISGPGNAADEQARLENLDNAYLEGQEISIGQTTFEYEVLP